MFSTQQGNNPIVKKNFDIKSIALQDGNKVNKLIEIPVVRKIAEKTLFDREINEHIRKTKKNLNPWRRHEKSNGMNI